MGPLGHGADGAPHVLFSRDRSLRPKVIVAKPGEVVFVPKGVKIAPLVAANDPLPAETIAASALLCHRAGDWLMRASALAGALQRPEALARTEVHLATMRAELAQMIRVFEQVDESLATLRGLAERDARIQAMQAGEGGVS